MKMQRILRTVVAAAAIAAAPVVFAGAASAQSHGHRGSAPHDSGQSRSSPSVGPSRGTSGPSRGTNGWRDSGRAYERGRGRDVVIVNRGPRYGYDYRRPYFYGPSLALGFGLGYNYAPYRYGTYDTYYDSYYDGYDLYPGECRSDYRWDYWSGRPAEIAVRICADSYGRTYVVRDSRRWVRWR